MKTGPFSCVLLLLATTAQALEIRVAPPDSVFLNENNRRIGIYDVVIQNIAVVNHSNEDVTLKSLEIVALRRGQRIASQTIPFEQYEKKWVSRKKYFERPGVMQSQDSIFLFSQLLAGDVELADSTTLAPGTALMIDRRLMAFSEAHVADAIRIWVSATTAAGESRDAQAELDIVLYRAKNEYRFPLRGRWYVGASSSVRSHHRTRPAHEFALDLLKIGDGGKSHRGSGTRPADYYAFGEEVLAIADGTVIRAVNDVPETDMPKEGETRREFAIRVLDAMWQKDPSGRIASGNLVILEHAGGEHSIYVHLKNGSVRVQEGDTVKQGQAIGQVGISGDGFQPHLHFQVNDGPDPQYSRSLPITFANVRPVPFASTIDMDEKRLFMAGEFVETID